MRIGRYELTTVSGGRFFIDGGTMFGVVPRSLWSRVFPPDERNDIAQATNCVLIRGEGRTVLIDTGYGSKLAPKQQAIFRAEPGDPLLASLTALGVAPEDVDAVVLSHLHFDHAGGATRRAGDGRLVPTFPRAEYVVQKAEWETALSGVPELRGAYPLENLEPLAEARCLRFVDGDGELLPGLRGEVTGGHTENHQAVFVESEGQTAVYLGDLCPTSRHLPTLWCMAYDVHMLQTRRAKPGLLGRIADAGWWALLDHDPDHAAIRLARDPARDFVVAETLATL